MAENNQFRFGAKHILPSGFALAALLVIFVSAVALTGWVDTRIDDRTKIQFQNLDRRLLAIEGKLDRLLERRP